MHEPSLFEMSRQDETAEVYRFLLLRWEFRPPISVRLVVHKDGTALLISKGMPGKGGYEPTMAPLPKEQTEWFRDLVEGFAAWQLPTRQTDGIGFDGAQWIVEMAKSGRYHVIDRWSPSADDSVHGLGMALLINLAQFNLRYEDMRPGGR